MNAGRPDVGRWDSLQAYTSVAIAKLALTSDIVRFRRYEVFVHVEKEVGIGVVQRTFLHRIHVVVVEVEPLVIEEVVGVVRVMAHGNLRSFM